MTKPLDIDYEALDPGIRHTVRWLRAQGFLTVDSGDGESKAVDHEEGEFLPFPHVAMLTNATDLVAEADRLRLCLETQGMLFDSMDPAEGPFIEATYSPVDGRSVLLLSNVNDALMGFPKDT